MLLLKVSNKDYFGHLWVMFFYLIFCLCIPSIFSFMDFDATFDFTVKIVIIAFIAMCVPAIILFFRYTIVSKSVEITYGSRRIKISLNGKCRTIELNEIGYVEIKLPLPIYFNGMRYFATDSFFYANVYLKSKERFTVTTLLDNELWDTKYFFGDKVKVVRKLRPICWPPNQKLEFIEN